MKFPKEYFEEPKLVVIPIVDVLLAVFLFLAIIAFKTPFVSVFVQLPEGEGREANLKILNISVDKDGKILLGDKIVNLSQLKQILKEKKPFVVNVTADERTPYKYVAKLLSTLQEIGITNVNLILKKANRG
jgi:biopolymer transport protein ExbD